MKEFVLTLLITFAIVFPITYIVFRITLGSWYKENRQFWDEGINSPDWETALRRRMAFEKLLLKWSLILASGISFIITGIIEIDKTTNNKSKAVLKDKEDIENLKIQKTADKPSKQDSSSSIEKPKEDITHDLKEETTHEDEYIETTVMNYHKAVEEERIYDALDFYVSYRKPQIRLDKLKQIGEGTEYYVIEEVRPLRYYDGGNKADVYVRVRQKPVHSSQEQVWEGVWIMEKENGEWKIVRTPGRRIR